MLITLILCQDTIELLFIQKSWKAGCGISSPPHTHHKVYPENLSGKPRAKSWNSVRFSSHISTYLSFSEGKKKMLWLGFISLEPHCSVCDSGFYFL